LYGANPRSGVFRNLAPPPSPPGVGVPPPPPPLVGGEDTLAGWRGGGGSIVRKKPDTTLYSTYESTLWVRERVASRHSHQYLSTKGTVSVLHSMRAEACKGPTFPKFPLKKLLPACTL
jgi:hypothetical protein